VTIGIRTSKFRRKSRTRISNKAEISRVSVNNAATPIRRRTIASSSRPYNDEPPEWRVAARDLPSPRAAGGRLSALRVCSRFAPISRNRVQRFRLNLKVDLRVHIPFPDRDHSASGLLARAPTVDVAVALNASCSSLAYRERLETVARTHGGWRTLHRSCGPTQVYGAVPDPARQRELRANPRATQSSSRPWALAEFAYAD
jgi:hypothetical protein